MRVKKGKRVLDVKSPIYIKTKVKFKRPYYKEDVWGYERKKYIRRKIKVGVRSVPTWIQQKKRPRAIRSPTLETVIRRSIYMIKLARRLKGREPSPKQKWTIAPTFRKPDYNLIELSISPHGGDKLNKLKQLNRAKYQEVLWKIALHLRRIYSEVNSVYKRNRSKVPKDTGALRKDLEFSLGLNMSVVPIGMPLSWKSLELKMGFSSALPYADYISKGRDYRTGRFLQLKHFGSPKSKRTGYPLIDPNATKSILNYNQSKLLKPMRMQIRKRLINLLNYIMFEFGTAGNPISKALARKFFTIKHLRGRI